MHSMIPVIVTQAIPLTFPNTPRNSVIGYVKYKLEKGSLF